VNLFVKRTSSVILALSGLFLSILSCTRIDTTELGDELIPVVDNVNTFALTLEVTSDNFLLVDTLPVISSDDLPVGEIYDDPEFGRTVSNLFFTIYPATSNPRPFNPYNAPDSVVGIDSVVLQLAFSGIYGDTNNVQTFRVEEIAPGSGFTDSSYYLGTGSFATSGTLGSKTVDFTKLNDSIRLIRKRDTSSVINVLRIPLNNALGERFADYDTTNSANGGYRSDSIFSTLFKGLAVKVDSNKATNKALAYFNLGSNNTKLQVYFRTKRTGGTIDTTVAEYFHAGSKTRNGINIAASGRASTIRRDAQHGYATYLSNGTPNDDRLYIQSAPGSYALLKIPDLDTMTNKVIHLAELIVSRVPSPGDNTFGLPNFLFMDMVTDDRDSALTVQNDFVFSNGTPNIGSFGGFIRNSDQTYRFNLTRHVQGIITRDEKNYALRLYAPYVTIPYYLPPGKASDYAPSALSKVNIPVTAGLGAGRVVLYGGAEADATKKLRLYIVYSKI
jgi:hypothetical protein